MTTEIKNIIEAITNQAQYKRLVILAIDGRGGSGKSTLAYTLKRNLKDAHIIHLDDFYLPSVQRIIDKKIPIDVKKLADQLLRPLVNNKETTYTKCNGKLSNIISPKGIIIIEGWFALHSELISYYDFKIWKDEDEHVCLQRGIERKLTARKISKELTKEQLKMRWLRYQELEDEYIEKFLPQKKADFIIR